LEAVLELVLCGVKLRKGRRQVFELFVELLLDLGKLLRLQCIEVDYSADRSAGWYYLRVLGRWFTLLLSSGHFGVLLSVFAYVVVKVVN
jgi:hypothetical protein